MRYSGKIQKLIIWLGLIAYLFLGFATPKAIIALTASLAGPHKVSIVADGSHQDIVFSHNPMQIHHHGHKHFYPTVTEAVDSISNGHPHPDHVVHLFKFPEQLSAYTILTLLDPYYLHSIILPMRGMALMPFFLKTVSILAFPQPPPLPPKIHRFLNTIILLI